jgi:protein-disulfide isomerase
LTGLAIEGDRNAPLAIIEYSDFQCPFCGTFARETLPKFREKYVRSGKVLLAFRHLPLSNIHPFAEKAAASAECAGRQGKFWQMHDELFRNQKQLDQPNLDKIAGRVGLDVGHFDTCLNGEVTNRINEDTVSAKSLGISGTPTFLIGTVQADGGVKIFRVVTGAQTLSAFDGLLSSEAVQARRPS